MYSKLEIIQPVSVIVMSLDHPHISYTFVNNACIRCYPLHKYLRKRSSYTYLVSCMNIAVQRMFWLGLLMTVVMNCYGQDHLLRFDTAYVEITGSSTLHDWTVHASEITDYPLEIAIGEAQEISSFRFSVVVSSMDGGRGSAMNNKIYKALLSTEHPSINYVQHAPLALASEESLMSHTINSTLEIAGVSNQYDLDIQTERTGDRLSISTVQPLLLSDFDIEPPSAMFGQIKTGDEIEVKMTFRYTYHEN